MSRARAESHAPVPNNMGRVGKGRPHTKARWDILAPEETGDSEAKLRPSFKEERVVGWLRSMPHSSNRAHRGTDPWVCPNRHQQ